MSTRSAVETWSLEVVRGAAPGEKFPLREQPVVLGNGPASPDTINLSAQEGSSPRRMAARQAEIEWLGGMPRIRDLDSPGGTFVNRRRVLPGQVLPLAEGDIIAVASVQLRVVRGDSRPQPVSTTPVKPASSFSFTLKNGSICRTWDEFLAISAQRWGDLRDELTSGRLAAFALSIGRPDLAPDASAPGSPDERLDLWLGTLPTKKPARPELDVHPRSIVVRVPAGGASIRKTLSIANTGYRLLRTTVRVEPASTPWLRIVGEGATRPLVTIDASEITIEITSPDVYIATLSASLHLDSDGGNAIVAVRVEPPAARGDLPDAPAVSRPTVSLGIGTRIRAISAKNRLIGAALGLGLGRLLLGLTARLPSALGLESRATPPPGLLGPALALAMTGAVLGLVLAFKKGEIREAATSAIAGSIGGVMLASVYVAVCRSVEPAAISGNPLVATLVWTALGATLAAISTIVIPQGERAQS